VFHFCDTLLAEHLIAPVVSSNFVLFDSGAAANVCPPDFASEWPLLPLTESPPPLRAISGDTLKILGRRLVGMNFGNADMYIHFYVCESIPYAIVSVARLLKQGYHVELGCHRKTLSTPNSQVIPIEQHGSLLYLNAKIKKFEKRDFDDVVSDFHTHFDRRLLTQGMIAAVGSQGSKPMVYYHADRWNFDPDNSTLTRLHVRPRKTLFTPDKIKDMPITPEELAEERYTYVTFKGKETKVLKDNWLHAKTPNADLGESWTGKTVFKLSSKAIGRRLSGKTSTLPVTDKTVRFPEELSPEEVEQLEPNPAVSSGYSAAGSKLSAETSDLSIELQKTFNSTNYEVRTFQEICFGTNQASGSYHK
jgi:hypothetical protein